jgi:hypothetical protein
MGSPPSFAGNFLLPRRIHRREPASALSGHTPPGYSGRSHTEGAIHMLARASKQRTVSFPAQHDFAGRSTARLGPPYRNAPEALVGPTLQQTLGRTVR